MRLGILIVFLACSLAPEAAAQASLLWAGQNTGGGLVSFNNTPWLVTVGEYKIVLASATNTVTVWPGDTNNDKAVNGADVLPLGFHFGRTGPARAAAERGCAFEARSVPPWTPEVATTADANGDGAVNGGDVLCIGFNFGKTHPSATGEIAQKTGPQPLTGPPLTGRLTLLLTQETNGSIRAEVHAEDVQDLLGAAFSLVYPPEAFEVTQVEQSPWLGQDVLWQDHIDAQTGKVGIGVTRRAADGGVSGTGILAQVWLRNKGAAVDLSQVGLEAPVGSLARGALGPLAVEVQQAQTAVPETFAVLGNYPNPFNPTTTIVFDLPEAAQVTVAVYDVLGRRVLALPSQALAAGSGHKMRLDASSLSSGTYVYRVTAQMETQTQIHTGRMLLIK